MNTQRNINPPAQALDSIRLDSLQKSVKMILAGKLISEQEASVLLALGIGYYKDYADHSPQDIALTRAGILFAKTFCPDMMDLNSDLNNSVFQRVHSITGMDVFKIPITEIPQLLKYTGKYSVCLAPISRISSDVQFIYVYC